MQKQNVLDFRSVNSSICYSIKMDKEVVFDRVFGTVDYVVFGALIVVSISIGIFFAIKDKKHITSVNYFLGDRRLKALPLGLSFVVTFQSSIMMLGSPAEVYVYGLQYALLMIGVLFSFYLAALIVVPLFHPLKVTSVYEYYQLRYGTNSVRYLGVVLGVLYYTLYIGIVLFGTALALESTTGLSVWISIVIFAAAATLYTSIGGIKAVIWTDVFQSIVMVSGILAVIIKSTTYAGGPVEVGKISKDRFNLFNFNPDPTIRHTFWTLVIGGIPQYFYQYITQAGMQRILSTPNQKIARRMLYIAAPIYCIVWTIVLLEGLSVFAYHYRKGCDPLSSGQISNPNQIIPFTILEMFHNFHGMPGLFIAALAAASLSTISSGLSGLAAVTCVDVLKVLKPNINDETSTNISKLFVVMYGLIATSFAFFLSSVKGPLGEIMAAFSGAVAGPETGLFIVSVFYRRSRPKAVFFAICVGLTLSVWLIIGKTYSPDLNRTPYLPLGPTDQCLTHQNITHAYVSSDNFQMSFTSSVSTPISNQSLENNSLSGLSIFYSISYMYIHLIGTVVTIILAVIGSLIPLQRQHNMPVVDERCILPLSIFIPSIFQRLFSKCSQKNEHNRIDDFEGETTEMLQANKSTNS